MFTSDVKKDGQTTIISADKGKQELLQEQVNYEMDQIVLKPILEYGTKLMNDKIVVKKIISDTEFVVYVEDLRTNLVLKQISFEEDLSRWIRLPPHSNITSIFDTFEHVDGDKQYKFSLTEMSNHGDMYKFIQSLNLKLDITIPLSYMEVIYDCMIQLTLAMEFAHNNGLCHGNFSLSNVALNKDGDTIIYKIKNFAPGSSIKLPVTDKWSFTRGRKNAKEAEKIEIIMLKDIYSLGIVLLELMIGRFSSKKFSISLDSLPLTWAEYQESTPLIQVLVECIQLDSITQRKGILTGIRKLLMKAHSQFFNKNYYKMGEPYIGKMSDILNKQAIAALFRDDEEQARQYWSEAMEKYPNHFDTKVNYELYQWKYGIISDLQLLENLQGEVFKNKYKGQTLEGIINIAIGQKAEGLKILEAFNNQKKEHTLVNYRDPSENLRRTKARNNGLEIFREVSNKQEEYFENQTVQTEHKSKIHHISITSNGLFMTTCDSECCIIWELEPEIRFLLKVDITKDISGDYDEEAEGGSDDESPAPKPTMAALDNECIQLYVYTGKILELKYFELDIHADKESEKINQLPNIDLQLLYQEANEKELYVSIDDIVENITMIQESGELRMYITQGVHFYQLNYNIIDSSVPPTFEKCDRYQDKSIFKYQNRFQDYFDKLSIFLEDQTQVGSKINFPEKEVRLVTVLNYEQSQKHFYVFDIYMNRFTRKILKDDFYSAFSMSQSKESENKGDIDPEAQFSSDAFDVDPKGQKIIYAYGRSLKLQTMSLPDSIKKHMAPQYTASEHKYSPARVQEVKQLMRNKINRDLDHYYQFGDNQTTSNLDSKKQTILQLMTLKYNQMCENKRIIQANDEFLTMSRILVKESQPSCPIVGISGLIKLQSFEKELPVLGDRQINLIQLVSQVPMNFMFIAIGGKVYKYNLVTKECAFEFKSYAETHMMLYDFDDKLIVADKNQIRLWDFYENKEEIPQLVTVLEAPLKIEKKATKVDTPQCLKVNKFAEESGERKGIYYYILASKDTFRVYVDRLDILLQGTIENGQDSICSIEFGLDTKHFYLGTLKGYIHKFELPSPSEVRNEYEVVKEGEPPKAIRAADPFSPEDKKNYDYSISLLYRVTGILEEDFFLMHVKNSGLKVWNQDKDICQKVECPEYNNQIDQIKATPDGKFVIVGFPNTGFIMFYRIEYEETNIFLLQNGKISMEYSIFETDDMLSSILFNNKRLNSLELYAIKWQFDTSNLDIIKLRKLDDERIGHDSDLPTSQRNSSSRRVHIDTEDVDGNKKSKCIIF